MISRFFSSAQTLWKRELIRFYRQPGRVVGAFASPLMFWILLGSGIGRSFHGESGLASGGYLQYFFPGTLLMIVFFTAVFSTISIIEDRREGFLQTVLVAPVPRLGIVFGKVLGGSTLAFVQALLFLFVAPLAGIPIEFSTVLKAAPALFLSGFLLTSLGFIMAWQFQSIQGYHAVMNLILMPMWVLSGALFPPEGASFWMQWAMRLNPLSYGYQAIRLSLEPAANGAQYAGALGWISLWAFSFFLIAGWNTRKNQTRDLR